MRTRLEILSGIVRGIMLALPLAQAQVTGEIRGRVLDPSDSAIPGAQLKLVDDATSIEKMATSAEDGGFVFLRLNTGSYRITTTASGFQTTVSSGIVVETGRTSDVVVRMAVGSIKTTPGSS